MWKTRKNNNTGCLSDRGEIRRDDFQSALGRMVVDDFKRIKLWWIQFIIRPQICWINISIQTSPPSQSEKNISVCIQSMMRVANNTLFLSPPRKDCKISRIFLSNFPINFFVTTSGSSNKSFSQNAFN